MFRSASGQWHAALGVCASRDGGMTLGDFLTLTESSFRKNSQVEAEERMSGASVKGARVEPGATMQSE